jgi:hypothetical protein
MEGLIKSENHGSIHFPFVLSAALARCIEGANGLNQTIPNSACE